MVENRALERIVLSLDSISNHLGDIKNALYAGPTPDENMSISELAVMAIGMAEEIRSTTHSQDEKEEN